MPKCRTIEVFAFRGDRSRAAAVKFQQALADEKNGIASGPTTLTCQLFAGHTGVSTNDGNTIYGFNPNGAGIPAWQLLDRLKNGEALPGIVRDDTTVFSTATNRGLAVLSSKIVFPQQQFLKVKGDLDAEIKNSQYSYGYPNGDGDCNCATWLERLGLPLLTGRMTEFVGLPGIGSHPSRRFGKCV